MTAGQAPGDPRNVARGACPTATLNRSYEALARMCGFEIDPCRASERTRERRGVG